MTVYPQVLVNVQRRRSLARGHRRGAFGCRRRASLPSSATSGRVLLRPSGTEQLVRVMVEAASAEVAQAHAERLAAVVRERLAL